MPDQRKKQMTGPVVKGNENRHRIRNHTWLTTSRRFTMRSLLPMMFGKAVALLQRSLEVRVLVFEKPPRDHAVDLDQQLVVVSGFGSGYGTTTIGACQNAAFSDAGFNTVTWQVYSP